MFTHLGCANFLLFELQAKAAPSISACGAEATALIRLVAGEVMSYRQLRWEMHSHSVAVPCRPAPRAAVRLMSRAARSAWGDRDDSPVSREARRVAQQAYNEAQREVAFAKRQLARAEEEVRRPRYSKNLVL